MKFNIFNKNLGLLTVEISDEDNDLTQYRWHLAGGKKGIGQYLATSALKYDWTSTVLYLHREIARRMGLLEEAMGDGSGRSGLSIDHIDGNKLNNKRENLRLATRKEQMKNINDGLRSTNTSGYRGVSYIKKTGKYYANVMVNGKTINLGVYDTQDEAIQARKNYDENGTIPEKGIKLKANNSSGHKGVSYSKMHNKWQAYAVRNGIRFDLGRHFTKEEAVQAREKWDNDNKID